jgi:hypothetical protein
MCPPLAGSAVRFTTQFEGIFILKCNTLDFENASNGAGTFFTSPLTEIG